MEKGGSRRSIALAKGVNLVEGRITHKGVADAFGLPYTPLQDVLVTSPNSSTHLPNRIVLTNADAIWYKVTKYYKEGIL